ncbi:MAG: hypothetical protein M3Z05_15680 [Gemmatimonadota bacterium]|nr:hypothetical protein [Gemmatimonadota bacterium]
MRRSRAVILALLLIAIAGPVARAQTDVGISIISLQALNFGLLIPGVPEHIDVTDVPRRAMLVLTGAGTVDITLVLPRALTSRTGDEIPILFGSSDAARLSSPAGAVTVLNALQVNRVQITVDRPLYIVIGGCATAATIQHPGSYTAAVALIVSQPGT